MAEFQLILPLLVPVLPEAAHHACSADPEQGSPCAPSWKEGRGERGGLVFPGFRSIAYNARGF